MLFDTHAHLCDAQYDEDLEQVLAENRRSGVEYILTCSSNMSDTVKNCKIANAHDNIFFASGIHPQECGKFSTDDLETVEKYASDEKCRAIGECGLDYYYDDGASHALQQEFFRWQCEIAKKLSLPIVVHDRDAHADTLKILQECRPKFVLHCYSGSLEMAKELLKIGGMISFAGVLTFKNSKTAKEVAQAMPHDRVFVETDCPYLAPEPMRGKRNMSAYVKHTAAYLASLWNVSYEEVCQTTTQNAKDFFKIGE